MRPLEGDPSFLDVDRGGRRRIKDRRWMACIQINWSYIRQYWNQVRVYFPRENRMLLES
jgi:hypothetical protein